MKFGNRLRDIMKVELKEDETTPSNDNQYFAIETTTDLEGNSIPNRYRPVYIAKYGDGDYDFTKRLMHGRSLFSKANEQEELDALKNYLPDLKVTPKYGLRANDKRFMSDDQFIADDEKADKHDQEELVKNKEKLPNLITPTSKIMHSATYVDPREIEAFAKNGINPTLAYASNPKPGWWYEDNDGKKHLIRLYGITDDGYAGEPQVVVREVLPFKLTNGGYLRQVESDGYLMPVEQFKEIIHNPFNKETYEYLLRKVPEEERENQELWMSNIAKQKQVMQDKFTNWKEKNEFKYDLGSYTKDSLLKVYFANEGQHFPMDRALAMYGKKQKDIEDKKARTMFDDWYEANKEKYALDRFDNETLENIFTDIKTDGMSMEDAIMNNADLDFEDEDVEESVLTEKDGNISDDSKEWIISDPNLLRDIVLPNLGISPVYVSNPFKVSYVPWGKSGEPDELDVVDKKYYITGIRKPDLYMQPDELNASNVKTAYIKSDEKGSRQQAISFKELRRMLDAPENDNPIPNLWDRYRTYQDQRKPLNKGAHYKWTNLDDSLVIQMLEVMQTQENYKDADLVGMFNKAKETHEENQFVSRAMRDFDRTVSFRARIPGDFRGYQFPTDIRTGEPTKAKNQGMGSNPYEHLMKMKAN